MMLWLPARFLNLNFNQLQSVIELYTGSVGTY
jgi:hypothetical protein